MKGRGLLYVATGQRYVDEVIISAQSAKRNMPDIKIVLFTDQSIENKTFDQVYETHEAKHYVTDKIRPLLSTPFEMKMIPIVELIAEIKFTLCLEPVVFTTAVFPRRAQVVPEW